MRGFLIQRWFLIALVLALVLGITFAAALQPLSEWKLLRNCIVAAVLFVMALPLEARAVVRSMRHPGPPLLASFVNLGLLPLFAWSVSLLLRGDAATGLLVAATTPCTLASASVWTRRAGGNDTVSILVTVSTNSLCFLITPLWLVVMTGESVDRSELSLGRMSLKLGMLVVLPMALAQLLRLHRPLAVWSSQSKVRLGVLAQCGVLSMIFLGAIRTGVRLQSDDAQALLAWDLVTILAAVNVVHISMLWTGICLTRWSRFSREDQIAVAFAGSQKTLMVGLLVAISLQVSILPMVAYHVCQLFIDTLIADRFRKKG
ncbi:MAG: bile acid:sodium symporter family protein [Pirellulaceae bacterium]